MFEVWMEGFSATGDYASAQCQGSFKGHTFQEACIAWVNTLELSQQLYYNSERNSYWGCKLFDNEIDARRSFG